jgi:hypothetical protein
MSEGFSFGVLALLRVGEERARRLKERLMLSLKNQRASIYVDRSSQQWVVRDPDGKFWTLTSTERAWEHRQPFTATDRTELEPVPGHYKVMLDLPF